MIAAVPSVRRSPDWRLFVTVVVVVLSSVTIWRRTLSDSRCNADWLSADCVTADVRVLHRALSDEFAYRELSSPNLFEALHDLEMEALPQGMPRSRFVHRVRLIVGHLFDSHAHVSAPGGDERFAPMLVEATPRGLVAIRPDRSDFVSPGNPYLDSIDGVHVSQWLAVAGRFVPAGSPAYRERQTIGLLRNVELLRTELGRPRSAFIEVRLRTDGGTFASPLLLPLMRRRPLYDVWPERTSGFVSNDLVYLRLPRMDAAGAEAVREWIPRAAASRGLIVDVRGNRGGSRSPVLELYSRLTPPSEPPRVVNVAAAKRGRHGAPSLSDRFLFPASARHWTPREREAIDRWRRDVRIPWPRDAGAFGEWHFMIAEPSRHGAFMGAVVVLADAASFSATDVFLAAIKGRPNVVILGQPTGGGSGRPISVTLTNARITIWLSSMVSLQPDGMLYDGRGVQPDFRVGASPTDFLRGGSDAVLDSAVEHLRRVSVPTRAGCSPAVSKNPACPRHRPRPRPGQQR